MRARAHALGLKEECVCALVYTATDKVCLRGYGGAEESGCPGLRVPSALTGPAVSDRLLST